MNLDYSIFRPVLGGQESGNVARLTADYVPDLLFSTPSYIGASLEAGNAWRDKSDVRLDSLIYGGSIFAGLKTPLGPVFLGYGYAEGGHDAVYLTFGSSLRNEPQCVNWW